MLADSGVEHSSGALFDLGVSSPQLDHAERGFSYRNDGPLDMRMDRTDGSSAADVVNGYDEVDLARVIRDYGDERFARRIARAIVAARPITTTTELAGDRRRSDPGSDSAHRRPSRPSARSRPSASRSTASSISCPDALDQAIDATVPHGPGRRADVPLR